MEMSQDETYSYFKDLMKELYDRECHTSCGALLIDMLQPYLAIRAIDEDSLSDKVKSNREETKADNTWILKFAMEAFRR